MVKEYNYISIKEVLSRVLRHPLLQEVTLEEVIQYVVDFLYIFGMPNLYKDKQDIIQIVDYRGILPCDYIAINQVKDCKSGICLRNMTDTFTPDSINNRNEDNRELTFKTQGNIIYVSFKTGEIYLSYKAIPVDKDGYPLLIDNAVFLKTLEAYIKKEVFTVLFDMGKIAQNVLQNTQQQYAWLAGQLQSEFTIPSISELESIKNSWCTLLQRTTDFDRGFRNLGNREYIKVKQYATIKRNRIKDN